MMLIAYMRSSGDFNCSSLTYLIAFILIYINSSRCAGTRLIYNYMMSLPAKC